MSSRAKVFIVEGSSGYYEDHREWPVLAFLDRADAEELAATLKAESDRLREVHEAKKDRWRAKYDGLPLEDQPDSFPKPSKNKLDPSWDGNDTSYYVVEVDLRGGSSRRGAR